MADEKNRSGLKQKNLYEILGIEKSATDDEIKRVYRKLALKFHPDKNHDGDPAKTERFKEINHAHAILSNSQKRKIYDDYGEIGLKMADQFGEERMSVMLRPWVKWLCCTIAILTCGCFGCCCCFMCCCQCCCDFCCGKCKLQSDESFGVFTEPTTSDVIIDTQPGVDASNQTMSAVSAPQPNDAGPRISPTLNNASPTNYGATEI